jgi:hypothetical protein
MAGQAFLLVLPSPMFFHRASHRPAVHKCKSFDEAIALHVVFGIGTKPSEIFRNPNIPSWANADSDMKSMLARTLYSYWRATMETPSGKKPKTFFHSIKKQGSTFMKRIGNSFFNTSLQSASDAGAWIGLAPESFRFEAVLKTGKPVMSLYDGTVSEAFLIRRLSLN